jgi:hypothetical protein
MLHVRRFVTQQGISRQHPNSLYPLKSLKMNLKTGMSVYLKQPYKGYRVVVLIEKCHYKWLVEVAGSGLQLEFYEDEFEYVL